MVIKYTSLIFNVTENTDNNIIDQSRNFCSATKRMSGIRYNVSQNQKLSLKVELDSGLCLGKAFIQPMFCLTGPFYTFWILRFQIGTRISTFPHHILRGSAFLIDSTRNYYFLNQTPL